MEDPSSSGRWRNLVAIILVVFGCLLFVFATIAVWSHGVALNTDRCVETA